MTLWYEWQEVILREAQQRRHTVMFLEEQGEMTPRGGKQQEEQGMMLGRSRGRRSRGHGSSYME